VIFILDRTNLVLFYLGIPPQNWHAADYDGCLASSSLACISLSDIVSADGTKIVSPTLKGQQMLDRQSLLAWPAQHNPTNSDWDLWLSSLSSLCVGSTLIQHIILQPIQGHQTWFWYMDSHRTLFLNDDQTWRNIPPLTPLCELLGRMWAYIGPPLQRPAPHRLLPYRTPASNGKGILPRQYRVTTQLPYHPLHHRILLGRHPLQIAFPCQRDYTLSTSTSSLQPISLVQNYDNASLPFVTGNF
jgi:hypothetical protein